MDMWNQEEWQSFPDMAQRLSQVYTGSVLTDGRPTTHLQQIQHFDPYDNKPVTGLRLLHSTGSPLNVIGLHAPWSPGCPTGVLQTRLSKEDVLSLLRQHLAANSLFLPSSRHERRHVAGHEQADATVANGRNASGLGGFAKGSILRQVCR
jgi:hypothetical protein